MAFQSVTIKGNLGKDPETTKMQSGDTVTNFSVAVSESYKNKSGEKVDSTEWFNCVSFGKQGEVISKYFGKGSGILIIAKRRTEKFQDKSTGADRTAEKYIVREFDFVDKAGSNDSQQAPQQQAQPQSGGSPNTAGGADFVDDIPFNSVQSYP